MKLRHVSLVICLSLSMILTGCSFHMPIVSPDDTNVLSLCQSGVSDISKLTVDVKGTAVYGSGEKGLMVSYQNQMQGDISEILKGTRTMESFDLTASDESAWQVSKELNTDVVKKADTGVKQKTEWYLDTDADAYYERQTDADWSGYQNGTFIIDMDWWLKQMDTMAFRYDGKTKDADGRSCYLLGMTYSGHDLVSLLKHLGLRWDVDASSSDMYVQVFVDTWSGVPTQISINASNTGSPVMISDENGVYQLSVFDFDILLHYKAETIAVPKTVTGLELQEPGNSLLVVDAAKVDKMNGLSLHGRYVNVEANEVFDTIDFDMEKNMISVSSSKVLDGQPTMTISLVDNMDAYTNAVSDRNVALDFYDDLGLSEIYVPKNITQLSVAECPTYFYHTQYTDNEYGFVNTDYFAYISLSDTSFAKVVVSSMVDQGVSVILTDSYVKSMLSQITVEGGDSVD